jgi:hypothetical protein
MGSGGVLIGQYTERFLMLGCLLTNNDDRNGYFKGSTSGGMANCLVYNWGQNPASYMANPEVDKNAGVGANVASFVGNVWKRGPNTSNVALQFYGPPNPSTSGCSTGSLMYVDDNRVSNINSGLTAGRPVGLREQRVRRGGQGRLAARRHAARRIYPARQRRRTRRGTELRGRVGERAG